MGGSKNMGPCGELYVNYYKEPRQLSCPLTSARLLFPAKSTEIEGDAHL